MKWTLAQLEQQASRKLATVYLISGEEILLKEDALQCIRSAAKQAGFEERSRFDVESGQDWNELHQMLYARSLLSQKRIIELNFQDNLPPKAASEVLCDYARNPILDQLLLINLNKVDAKVAKSAWYIALEALGIAVAVWPIPREQLPQWLIQRAKKHALDLQRDAAEALAEYSEGNLIAAAQFIEKLILLKPQQKIIASDVRQILADESRFTIFDFVDQLITDNKAKALQTLRHLKEDNVEPAIILWSITRELRQLAELALAKKNGTSLDSLFQKHRIFARRQPLLRRFLAHTTPEHCWQLLTHASAIDAALKGISKENPWHLFELFCLRVGLA